MHTIREHGPDRVGGFTPIPASPRNLSLPELIVMTGMPARSAERIPGPSTVASGSETTMPSGCRLTASSSIFRIRLMSYVSGAE